MKKDDVIDKIKSGHGLDPLPQKQSTDKPGTTKELRGEYPGTRKDIFDKANRKKENKIKKI